MMQHTDTDIDLTLDDDAELVYETTGWNRLVHGSTTALIVPALVAVFAEFTDRSALLTAAFFTFWVLVGLAVFALVMEFRADHRSPEVGGHSA